MLCDLFAKLHSQGRPHSIRHTKRELERAFDRDFCDIFAEFDEQPLGVGAIAQVYKATLRRELLPAEYSTLPKHEDEQRYVLEDEVPLKLPSQAVAIKILHPGVAKTIARDLKIMAFFARAINALPGAQWLSFPEEVAVFGAMMMSQVDMRIEATNLDQFEHNFRCALARRRD